MGYRKLLLSFVAAMVCGTCLVGCGPKKPEGFPEVAPFTVKIVDGSTPIADVAILFIGNGNAVIQGMTDVNGVAEIQTRLGNGDYMEKGAPAGEYRVQCTKDPMVEHWKTAQERAEMSIEEQGAYNDEWQKKCDALPREIPKIWGNFDKTPLKVEVPAGGGEVTFDVEGKANE